MAGNRAGRAPRENAPHRDEPLLQEVHAGSSVERYSARNCDALVPGQRRAFHCRACDHEADVRRRDHRCNVGSFSARCPGGGECLRLIADQLGCAPYQLLDPETALMCLAPWLMPDVRTELHATPEALPSEDVIAWWHEQLMTDREMQPQRRYLWRVRGLVPKTVRRYGIGYGSFHGRPCAFMHPVRDLRGKLVNLIESYWPETFVDLATGKERKARVLARRAATLYPAHALRRRGKNRLLVLTEGRWKAPLLDQHGIRAVTATNGSIWKSEWTPVLAGQQVAVLYDVDAETKALARAENFRAHGIDAWPVLLSASGFTGTDGVDDALRRGWTVGHMRSYIRAARPS